MKLTGKKSAKRAVSCKFCYSKIKIRWPKVPSWVKQCWAQQLSGRLVTFKEYSRSFWNLIEIILGEFSWNCIISVHVEVQKEKEKFAVMCLRPGVHKTSHKIIGTLSKDDDHGSENYGKKSSKDVKKMNDYDVKPPDLTFYGGRGHTTMNFPSSFWIWLKSLRIQLQEKSPAFDILSGSKWTR